MGKLHQTPPLPTVTALKQETYEVAKILRKKKGDANLFHAWATHRLILFLLMKQFIKTFCKE